MYYELNTGIFSGDNPPKYYDFKYKLDNFQLFGFDAINKNHNILVTAHTGAGKTSLALYAIAKHLNQNNNIIYTSPIKTLSNQKFKDFSQDFNDVGIMTGDVKINPDAKLMIMTAEILRNAILRKDNDVKDVYDWNFDANKIKCVILDEVHFINDSNRGMVWEEIITNLDPKIQIIMLSATINGAEKLARWVGNLKKIVCHHIPTPFRPVPLKHYIYFNKMKLILEGDKDWKEGVWNETIKDIKDLIKKKKFKSDEYYLESLLKEMIKEDMLPSTIFLLNKKHVEQIANNININFITFDERKEIEKIWNKYLLKYREIYSTSNQWNMLYSLVSKGIGIHHSGLIPILKEIIEILYEKKLLKILIATETFAMGVNMPTKTTIFTNFSKYDGTKKRLLNTEEYIQMAGRAGRRGLDKFGSVIFLPLRNLESENDVKRMMIGSSRELKSKLNIDYSYVLKQLSNYENIKSEKNFNDYIIDNIFNTFMGEEIINSIDFEKQNLKKIKEEYDKLKNSVDKNQLEYYFEYKKIENKINSSSNSWIKLDKKSMKKLEKTKNNQLKKIEKLNLEKLNKVFKLDNEIKNNENRIQLNNQVINNQINILMNFLENHNFINEKKLTPYGKIMSQVNECNPIILGYIIKEKLLEDMDFKDVVSLLSIFIEDLSLDKTIENLKTNDKIKDKMYHVAKLVNNFATQEDELNKLLPYPLKTDWKLHLSLFEAVKEWCEGKQWNEISHLYPTFEGNFIKNVLRLNNLIKNVYNIALIIKNTKLINLLENFEEKLIRDFVTSDSLYL